ncbi:reverse transcriptase zinc-binding domain-containing protein [Tanacetum coccineum]
MGTPKHSFMMWLAIQGRLMTQDRMAKWNPTMKLVCALCDKCPDSHDHLFFQCQFSNKVWDSILKKMDCKLLNKWSDVIPAMISLGFKNSIGNIARRLMLGATTYMIWQEKNMRTFQAKKRAEEVLTKLIIEQFKISLMSLTLKDTNAVRKMEEKWNVKMTRSNRDVNGVEKRDEDVLGVPKAVAKAGVEGVPKAGAEEGVPKAGAEEGVLNKEGVEEGVLKKEGAGVDDGVAKGFGDAVAPPNIVTAHGGGR